MKKSIILLVAIGFCVACSHSVQPEANEVDQRYTEPYADPCTNIVESLLIPNALQVEIDGIFGHTKVIKVYPDVLVYTETGHSSGWRGRDYLCYHVYPVGSMGERQRVDDYFTIRYGEDTLLLKTRMRAYWVDAKYILVLPI